MEQQLFTAIDASITGDIDAGLFLINGRLNKGVSMQQAEDAIDSVLESVCRELIPKKRYIRWCTSLRQVICSQI